MRARPWYAFGSPLVLVSREQMPDKQVRASTFTWRRTMAILGGEAVNAPGSYNAGRQTGFINGSNLEKERLISV